VTTPPTTGGSGGSGGSGGGSGGGGGGVYTAPGYIPGGSGNPGPSLGGGPGAGGAAGGSPTAGGPGGPGGGPGGLNPLGGLPGLAGIGNNVSGLADEGAGLLTEGMTPEQIEAIKKGIVKRVWFEKGKTIQSVAFDVDTGIKGDKVNITAKTKDFEPDTPMKLTVWAFHSPAVVREKQAPYRLELATLEGKVDADGKVDVEFELNHEFDAKIKVRAKIDDFEKSSLPLQYTVEEPGEEGLSTDEDEEVELPAEEGEDVNAIVGDKIKLMAELEQMPDNTPIKFVLYPDGSEPSDAFATVVANSLGDEVSSEWTVEYHEDAAVTCQAGTDFHQETAENKLNIATEALDDLSTDEDEEEGEEEDPLVTADAGAAAKPEGEAVAADAAAAPSDDSIVDASAPVAKDGAPVEITKESLEVDDLASAEGAEPETPAASGSAVASADAVPEAPPGSDAVADAKGAEAKPAEGKAGDAAAKPAGDATAAATPSEEAPPS